MSDQARATTPEGRIQQAIRERSAERYPMTLDDIRKTVRVEQATDSQTAAREALDWCARLEQALTAAEAESAGLRAEVARLAEENSQLTDALGDAQSDMFVMRAQLAALAIEGAGR